MAEEEKDNKSIAIEIAKSIGTNLSATLKNSFLGLTKVQSKGTTGFLKSAEDLVDENKAKQESFSNSLASIKDAITSALPKVIESVKITLASPAASEGEGGLKGGLAEITQSLKDNATNTIVSLGSVFRNQSDEVEQKIQNQTDFTQDSAREAQEGQASTEILAVESEKEKARADTEQMQILRDIRDSLTGSFATFKDRDKKGGGLLAGLLGGVGTGIGAIGKGIAKIGTGFAKGLIAIGAGIAGFMLALGGADYLLSLMGADGTALKSIIENFFGAFTEESAAMMGGIIIAAATLTKLKVKPLAFAAQMAALGAGITGFMGGILIGELIGTYALKSMSTMDGSAVGTILNNFFTSLTKESAAGLGVVVTIAGLLTKLDVSPWSFARQMAGVGAGIVGFAGGLMIGDTIAYYGMKALGGMDGSSLTTIMNNFFSGMTTEAQAGLGIVVTIAGLLTALKVDPWDFAKSMAGVGAGIVGFAGGLMIGDTIAYFGMKTLGGIDGSSLSTIMNNFFAGMTTEAQAGLGIVTAIAGLLTAFKVDPWDFAKSMAGVGAGIVGFAAGIMIGDAVAYYGMKALGGIDGSSLTNVMNNFFAGMTAEAQAGLGIVIAIAGVLTAFKVSPWSFARSMAGVGAGISGFMAGILVGDAVASFGMKALGGVDGKSLTAVLNNFFGGITKETVTGMTIITGLAVALEKFNVKPKDFALSMAGVGAGIAGFTAGLLMGDAVAKFGMEALGGLDGTSLITLLSNFFGAMTEDVAGGLGVIVTAGALIAKFNVPAAQMVLGMSALGAGIAGFSLGILLADGAAKLGAMAGLDGGSLKTLMGNFLGIFDGIGTGTLIALFVAVAAAALAPPLVILGFTALGAGIAAFMGFLVAADWIASFGTGENLKVLLTNIGGSIGGFIGGIGAGMMKQLEELDADKLGKLGEGIKNIGVGMLAFAGGQVAGAAGSLVSSIASLFGGDSPIDMITNLSKDKSIDAERLKTLGDGIAGLGLGMKAFGEIDADAIKNNITQINALGQVEKSTFDNVGALAEQGVSLAKSTGTALGEGAKGLVESVKSSSVGDTLTKLKEQATNKLVGDEEKPVDKAIVGTGQEGAIIDRGGLWDLHGTPKEPEFLLDNQASAVFMKAATLLTGSQMLEQSKGGSGSPVIINQVDNSQRNPVVSNQATQIKVPDNPRPSDPTMLAVQGSQMFN